ncbi:hypothetical protein M3Y97_01054900 [Aphelenchoides bicaudatus]|nr:hypothetical protein M3Y97_01054900 [Aphelenchoides bicaudatus]
MDLPIFAGIRNKNNAKLTEDVELGQMTQQSGAAENLVNEEQVALVNNDANGKKEGEHDTQAKKAFLARSTSNNAVAVESRNNIGIWAELSCVKKIAAICAILAVLISGACGLFSGAFGLFTYLQHSKDESDWQRFWLIIMLLALVSGFVVSGVIVLLLCWICCIWRHRNDHDERNQCRTLLKI